MNKKYTVFLSSTYDDLREERREVIHALLEIDCFPCSMETFPADDDEQFEFIKSIIDECDYYILIIAGRYGTIGKNGKSFTEMEYMYAIQKDIPVLTFIHSDINSISLSKSEKNLKNRKKLDAFIKCVSQGKLVKYWNNKEDLAGKVSRSMISTIKRHPSNGWMRGINFNNRTVWQKKLKNKFVSVKNFIETKRLYDIVFQTFDFMVSKYCCIAKGSKMTELSLLIFLIDRYKSFLLEHAYEINEELFYVLILLLNDLEDSVDKYDVFDFFTKAVLKEHCIQIMQIEKAFEESKFDPSFDFALYIENNGDLTDEDSLAKKSLEDIVNELQKNKMHPSKVLDYLEKLACFMYFDDYIKGVEIEELIEKLNQNYKNLSVLEEEFNNSEVFSLDNREDDS